MNRLLIQACSAKKLAFPDPPISALERYDGPFFRVIRKWKRETGETTTRILILSAKLGLIDSTELIQDYDLRMTRSAAEQMSGTIIRQYESLTGNDSFSSIFVNVGRSYLPALSGIPALKTASFAGGGIGVRARELKNWLNAISQ